jgi:BolA protein
MSRAERIEAALTAAFAPDVLAVEDESERHRGHGGWRDGGETHYRVRLVSAAFRGLPRVARHRAVNAALAAEFERGLHALALDLAAPGEAAA